MTLLLRCVFALSILLRFSGLVCGEKAEKGIRKATEARSPDGKFAFRYTGTEDSEKQTYDLVDAASGKVGKSVAESDPDLGSSARFHMEVLWRPDSKAFALTATFWKRGSSVEVFVREGSKFRETELPKLEADIPEKLKAGKDLEHIVQLNSQSARKWQKDGSLVVQIDNTVDGNAGSVTATRTVTLGFDRPGKARILKSTMKYDTGKDDLATDGLSALQRGDFDKAIALYDRALKAEGNDFAAYYHRGCAYFVKREWKKALADFQRHCDLRKDEGPAFPARFYIWLIRARLGDRARADKELAPCMEGHPAEWSGGWDAKIGTFLLDRIDEHDFLAALSDNPGTAWFYVGEKRLLNNDKASAAEAFQNAVTNGEESSEDYQMAASELKALNK